MVGPVLYEATVPFFRKALENQVKLLKKGKEWCKENGHDETKLSNGRLVDDMFVSIACDSVIACPLFTDQGSASSISRYFLYPQCCPVPS